MKNTLLSKLGPGLIFAAVAVGTSHVVQSTRAGATFGLSMILLVVLVCLAKYPTYLFCSRYAAITGQTVLDGYAKRGKWFLYIFQIVFTIEMTVASSASALVTSGIVINLFNLDIAINTLSMILMFFTIIILVLGKYNLLELLCRVLVIGFAITTLIATTLALTGFELGSIQPVAELTLDRPTTAFLVSLSGWMPTGIMGTVMLSIWVQARKASTSRAVFTKEDADFDFHVGYFSSMLLAICFVILGYVVILGQGDNIANDSVGFSVQIISLFTETIGNWVFILISATIIAVMYSTLLALVDAFPRLTVDVLDNLLPGEKHSEQAQQKKDQQIYIALCALLFVLVGAVFYLFMSSFTQFIDLITAIGFILTPIIAVFNHMIIFSKDIPLADQPGPVLKYWSYGMIAIFTLITFIWIYFRISA
ncbi:MAG: hypothetical protein CMP91_07515 [Gammaproteobacteria bacterium]|nr:hypothetical protein [Gammaproteobacteria bacterium]|tara:strand:+ start:377340 stop:378605 length:1266 start_codon:yes stop_codon:yes gene_type:complete